MAASGDPCPVNCGGRMRCISSRNVGDIQTQRLECKNCGHRETAHVEERSIWRRGKRSTVEQN